jgi:amino acid adenylation domain-containing protein
MTNLLQDYVTRTAQTSPDSDAIVMGSDRWSYRDVDRFSNNLARRLQASCCGRNDRVALYMPKSPRSIASIIGILKAGCAYVPIDVSGPAARASRIIESAEPGVMLVDETTRQSLEDIGCGGVLLDVSTIGFESSGCVQTAGERDDAAYILYTSGSTGVPKGVVITHGSVISFVEWAIEYFQITREDRMSAHPPLHFDLSVFDIFGAFAAGAGLHVPPTAINISASAAADFIRSSQLTHWFSVPSLLTFMAKFDAVQSNDFPTLKRVLWCGEVLPTPVLRHWMLRLPHVRFTNLYGPTETTIASSYFTVEKVPEPADEIPIGTACSRETMLILDEHLRPVKTGTVGNLFIGGAGVSPGYWRDPGKTEQCFIADPFASCPSARLYRTGDLARADREGRIYFVGRNDSQIKSRGYRIELGEIETVLNTIPGLKESAIVAVATDGFENQAICCAYSTMDPDVSPAAVRSLLRKTLPNYMLPSRWLKLEELPKNANGKVDKPFLRDLFREQISKPAGTRA